MVDAWAVNHNSRNTGVEHRTKIDTPAEREGSYDAGVWWAQTGSPPSPPLRLIRPTVRLLPQSRRLRIPVPSNGYEDSPPSDFIAAIF